MLLTDGTTASAVPFAVNDRLSLIVTNVGGSVAKSGQVILYVK